MLHVTRHVMSRQCLCVIVNCREYDFICVSPAVWYLNSLIVNWTYPLLHFSSFSPHPSPFLLHVLSTLPFSFTTYQQIRWDKKVPGKFFALPSYISRWLLLKSVRYFFPRCNAISYIFIFTAKRCIPDAPIRVATAGDSRQEKVLHQLTLFSEDWNFLVYWKLTFTKNRYQIAWHVRRKPLLKSSSECLIPRLTTGALMAPTGSVIWKHFFIPISHSNHNSSRDETKDGKNGRHTMRTQRLRRARFVITLCPKWASDNNVS